MPLRALPVIQPSPNEPHAERSSLRDLLPAGLLFLAGMFALLIANLATDTVPGQYVVITQPNITAIETLSLVKNAGGALIGAGGVENIVFAASDRPEFSETLKAAGAWLVFPAPTFLGCDPNILES